MPALFERDGDAVVATGHSRGPWDVGACHAGPVAAVLAYALEADHPADMVATRLTVRVNRPVPVERALRLATAVPRPGKKVQMLTAALTDEAGTEVAAADLVRVRAADIALPEERLSLEGRREWHRFEDSVPGPPSAFRLQGHTMFHIDSAEYRFSRGSWSEPGPAAVWIRVTAQLFEGVDLTPLGRVVAAADFANGVASSLLRGEFRYMNTDLTAYLVRRPEGEWIGLESEVFTDPVGAGMSDSALYDRAGRLGRSNQGLFVEGPARSAG